MNSVKIWMLFLFALPIANDAFGQVLVGDSFMGSVGKSWHVGGQAVDYYNPLVFAQDPISLSEDGSRIAVHSYDAEIASGIVGVYEWSGSKWEQLGENIIGYRPSKISNDGNRIAVRLEDSIRIMNWDGTTWNRLGENIIAPSAISVSLSPDGSWLVYNTSGSIWDYLYMYEWNGTSWSALGEAIKGPTNHAFALYVSLAADKRVMALSSYPIKGIFQTGVPRYVISYEWDGAEWQIRESTNTITPSGDDDELAFAERISISADGNSLAVNSTEAFVGGLVYLYDWDGTEWVKRAGKILSEGSHNGVRIALAQDGSKVYVGNPNYDISLNEGKAELFEWDGAEWQRKGGASFGTAEVDLLGHSVAISGDGSRVAVSSVNLDVASQEYLGQVQVFENFLTSTKDFSSAELKISPNPCDDFLQIENPSWSDSELEIQIHNLLGQRVYFEKRKAENLITIATENLPKGILMVSLQTTDEQFAVKVVKQ